MATQQPTKLGMLSEYVGKRKLFARSTTARIDEQQQPQARNISNDETVYVPAVAYADMHYQQPQTPFPQQVPLPSDNVADFCQDMNFIIARGNCLVTFPYENVTRIVLRLARHDENLIVAVYHDLRGVECRAWYLSLESFSVHRAHVPYNTRTRMITRTTYNGM